MGAVKVRGLALERDGKPFVPWGANYFVPGTGWAPQLWKTFDEARARADFARMRDLGVNVVRVFGTWMSFVESETKVNEEGFRKFDAMLRIADEHGILLHPTGPDHWEGQPAFMQGDNHYVISEHLLKGAENYWREMARRYKNDERILAYDILNEPVVHPNEAFWAEWERIAAPHNDPVGWPTRIDRNTTGILPEALLALDRLRNRYGDAWINRMADAIRTGGNNTLVTCGFMQSSFPLSGSDGFFLPTATKALDFVSIHYYPGNYKASVDYRRYLDTGVLWAAYARSFGKPLMFGELGAIGGNAEPFTAAWGEVYPPSTQEEGALWCRDLVSATRALACGWLTWGTYDIPEARDCTLVSGLFDADAQLKEWGRVFQAMAPTIAASRPLEDLPVVTFDADASRSRAVDLAEERAKLSFRLRTEGAFVLKEV